MKLEELLGEELYAKVKEKLDEVNEKEPDKLKHVRYADLSEGEYVGKGKHDSEIEKLNNLISGKDAELKTANDLIVELKKGTKGNEELQKKISAYDTEVANLQAQLLETKVNSALKIALMAEKAVDVDYLTYKLNEKLKENDEHLQLDENDNIKGLDDKLTGLKVQFPTMFETNISGGKNIIENKLKTGEDDNTLTKSDLLKKSYNERAKIFEENPEAYNAAMKS